ncbi:hypothetical protein L218DRAFT_994105 [Marasmius fiardii PR-910]|nr:hypothetical protein L218DRAFT_994105 [Marasmius fiardii PR-910]
MNNLRPFNVTLSSQTATILYTPYRDGDRATGWNVSYTYGAQDFGYGTPQGVGIDYHTTSFPGAALQFNWTGTAVYFYGNASLNTFSITVDDMESLQTFDAPNGGLLGKMEGLDYGDHSAKLTVTDSGGKEVAFQYAQVTIGLGFKNGSGSANRTVHAVNDSPVDQLEAESDFFNYAGMLNGWRVQDLTKGNSSPVDDFPKIFRPNGSVTNLSRQMFTTDHGDVVSFNLTKTSTFFLWGTVNQSHGSKNVSITGRNLSKMTILEDSSSVLDFWQVLYWESGLDRDETYTVTVMNGNNSRLAFSALKIIDGGSAGLNPAVVAAIDIGSLSFVAMLAVMGLIYWRRHSKANRPPLLHRMSIPDSIEFAPRSPPAANSHSRRASQNTRASSVPAFQSTPSLCIRSMNS